MIPNMHVLFGHHGINIGTQVFILSEICTYLKLRIDVSKC